MLLVVCYIIRIRIRNRIRNHTRILSIAHSFIVVGIVFHTRICIVTRLCIRSIARTRILSLSRIISRRRNHACMFTRIRSDIISCVMINIHMRMRIRTRYYAVS